MDSFKLVRGIALSFIIFTAIATIVGFILCIVFGAQILTHPEVIGEFFGKIIQGFTSSVR